MVLASTFYMLSTLEGPIQAVKSVKRYWHTLLTGFPGHGSRWCTWVGVAFYGIFCRH